MSGGGTFRKWRGQSLEELEKGAGPGARGKKREVDEGERNRLFSAKFMEDNEHPWHLTNECSGSSPPIWGWEAGSQGLTIAR